MNTSPKTPPPLDIAWPDGLLQVGHVLGAWGTQGWIKVAPASSEAGVLLKARRWWMQSPLGRPVQRVELAVRLARRHTASVVALLEGVGTRTQAEAMRGWTIHARREDFPPPGEGEYYWVDLIGCAVFNREGLELGTVSGLLDSGAQSILQLKTSAPLGEETKANERLIPFVDAYIVNVDTAARRIVVDWQPDYD
ncbi:ribosome maturation factor RimM [Thiomonas sp. FB-Cd]|uniref:ribosome maturation factor RimM n=1 Tax=Thiomonas sp. FB-Cd TaxID=1158292 RepID=UPI0018CC4BC7|nr:ribosome maturation factor RimM [Thiomonas sp. FB-Cd]